MSSFRLDGVRREIGNRWEARFITRSYDANHEGVIVRAAPGAGTWQRSGPNEERLHGIALYVHDADELRELAGLLLEAAAEVDALQGTETNEPALTPEEAKAIRVALIFGDPAMEGEPHDTLEAAKAKLRAMEASRYA